MKNPTTLMEALEYTYSIIDKLQKEKCDINLKPSHQRQDQRLIKKAKKDGRLPPHWWFHATILITDMNQRAKVINAVNKLQRKGITFDTGGCEYCIDWELDWSFAFKSKDKS